MLTGYTISRHLLEERGDRIAYIGMTMGFGEIQYKFRSANKMGDRIEAITNTGVIVVLSVNEKLIITMFPATIDKAAALFREAGEDKIPYSLYNTIKKNQLKGYLKMCI